MEYKRFLEITRKTWSDYFTEISRQKSLGLTKSSGAGFLFPTILLITQTKTTFVAELLGASDEFNGLAFKYHSEPSFSRYLSQFNINGTLGLFNLAGAKHISFQGLLFSVPTEMEKLRQRFPFVDLTLSGLISDRIDCVFTGADDVDSCMIGNCQLVNSYLNAISIKYILYLTAVNKNMKASEYKTWLDETLFEDRQIKAVHGWIENADRDLIMAGQLLNTVFINRLRETTIGEFLNQHPEIIKNSLQTRRFIYEPTLPWVEKHSDNPHKSINPDLLIERDDGYFDIYDLKLALIDIKNITTGGYRSRAFIQYVEKGLGQLANYEEYFKSAANQKDAYKRYGIRVNNPNLVLVVGSFNNVNKEEIEQASRKLRSNFSIIDYETLIQLFLKARKAKEIL